jgi:hypothetical protein
MPRLLLEWVRRNLYSVLWTITITVVAAAVAFVFAVAATALI